MQNEKERTVLAHEIEIKNRKEEERKKRVVNVTGKCSQRKYVS
jgi:hypothetical protein